MSFQGHPRSNGKSKREFNMKCMSKIRRLVGVLKSWPSSGKMHSTAYVWVGTELSMNTGNRVFSKLYFNLPTVQGHSYYTQFIGSGVVMRFIAFVTFFVYMCMSVCPIHSFFVPSPPLDNIGVMVIVWRLRGNIIRTALCWIVWQCSQSAAHLYEQFLQVKQIGFVTLRPLRCV